MIIERLGKVDEKLGLKLGIIVNLWKMIYLFWKSGALLDREVAVVGPPACSAELATILTSLNRARNNQPIRFLREAAHPLVQGCIRDLPYRPGFKNQLMCQDVTC